MSAASCSITNGDRLGKCALAFWLETRMNAVVARRIGGYAGIDREGIRDVGNKAVHKGGNP